MIWIVTVGNGRALIFKCHPVRPYLALVKKILPETDSSGRTHSKSSALVERKIFETLAQELKTSKEAGHFEHLIFAGSEAEVASLLDAMDTMTRSYVIGTIQKDMFQRPFSELEEECFSIIESWLLHPKTGSYY